MRAAIHPLAAGARPPVRSKWAGTDRLRFRRWPPPRLSTDSAGSAGSTRPPPMQNFQPGSSAVPQSAFPMAPREKSSGLLHIPSVDRDHPFPRHLRHRASGYRPGSGRPKYQPAFEQGADAGARTWSPRSGPRTCDPPREREISGTTDVCRILSSLIAAARR
jgi:hypothetical protein